MMGDTTWTLPSQRSVHAHRPAIARLAQSTQQRNWSKGRATGHARHDDWRSQPKPGSKCMTEKRTGVVPATKTTTGVEENEGFIPLSLGPFVFTSLRSTREKSSVQRDQSPKRACIHR